MIEITYSKAVELVTASVKDRGEDYVYPPAVLGDTCSYFKDGIPSCLVGDALSRTGLTHEDIDDYLNEESVSELAEFLN